MEQQQVAAGGRISSWMLATPLRSPSTIPQTGHSEQQDNITFWVATCPKQLHGHVPAPTSYSAPHYREQWKAGRQIKLSD